MKGFCAFVVSCVCLCALGGFQIAHAQEGFHPQDIPKQEHCRETYRDSERPRELTDEACATSPHRCDSDCRPAEHREAGCCTRCEPREGRGSECRDSRREPEPEQDCKARDDHDDPTRRPSKDAGLTITQFALYAEETLKLGDCTSVRGGDVGVRSTGEASRGGQLIIGSNSVVQPSKLVIAPSVAVGHHVIFGNLHANQLIDDGTVLRTTIPFSPASMPPLPLASSAAQKGPDVEVGSNQALALPPGNYGVLAIRGVLLLNPGQYAVKRVELGDFARIVAITGNVRMTVDETLAAGRYTAISPAFGLSAKHFSISVVGSASNGQPVASIGEHSRLRALVAAPHGSLALADAVRATGALTAYAVTVGADSRVRFEDGFPTESPGDHGSQQLHGYYGATANPAIAPFAGPVPNDQVIHLAIGLPGQNLPGLASFVRYPTPGARSFGNT